MNRTERTAMLIYILAMALALYSYVQADWLFDTIAITVPKERVQK